jgi:hypothetical protein
VSQDEIGGGSVNPLEIRVAYQGRLGDHSHFSLASRLARKGVVG